jgi:uncharacterized protein YfaS (alpha-2-macroglobulin family)
LFGSLHWGEDNYHWYGDATAATVTAFQVLQKEKNYDYQLNAIIQYFLSQRHGYWINTVQSASIVSTILPYILSKSPAFQQPSVLTVQGDTTFSIKNYPFKTVLNANHIHSLSIQKTGGGFNYLTLYQKYWNPAPTLVDSLFRINTFIQKNESRTDYLTAGEKTKMIIELNAVKEADYVMIEIPIPAGCTYAEKTQPGWNMHAEFLKNKIVLFAGHLEKGPHKYEIVLEPRYNGAYTLNPAKASLMYYPTFYGQNETKKINIK